MTTTHLDLAYGQPADAMLRDKQFLALWRGLHAECPHATAYQSPGFACAWYGAYRDQWHPVLVQSRDAKGGLIGLWLLAYNPGTKVLTHAGAHQAEYHAWLALPDEDASFIAAAWKELKRRFAFTTLRFKYLPSAKLLETLQTALEAEGRVTPRMHSRPLLILDENEIQAFFAKKNSKNQLNRLKKSGKLEFRPLTDSAELERVFEELVTYYDFRQSAVHHTAPFREDPRKRRFHADMVAAGESYVTLMYIDERPVAALWGAVSGKTVHLSMLIHSPFQADRFSPGKIHLMLSAEHMLETGKEVLDLTPGGDPWKERFANAHDEVAEVIVYVSSWKRMRDVMLDKLFQWAKRCAGRIGISPGGIRSALASLRRIRPSLAYRNIGDWLSATREIRIYRADRVFAEKYGCDDRVACNSLQALLSFTPGNSAQQTRPEFLSAALARLERGESVYTVSMDNRLVQSAWMSVDQNEFSMTEVKQIMHLSPESVIFHDFFTHHEFMSSDLCRATIGHMLHEAFSNGKIQGVSLPVMADNLPLQHILEEMGFKYQGSFYWSCHFGRERKWKDGIFAESKSNDA